MFYLSCVKVLLNSKLPVDVLGRVWDLSDIDGDGFLDREEFAIVSVLSFLNHTSWSFSSWSFFLGINLTGCLHCVFRKWECSCHVTFHL